MKSTLRLIIIWAAAILSVLAVDPLHPRGRVKWPGIRLGQSIAASDFHTERIPVDDLTEESLLRALTDDGSGGAPVEEIKGTNTESSTMASYHFGSHVRDGIKGGQLHREETRNGNKVSGSYSYSDGFVLRMVEYEADENGYRVIKDAIKRIGNGPKENDAGVANIRTEAHGQKHRYTVRGKDMTGPSMPGTEIARIISKRM